MYKDTSLATPEHKSEWKKRNARALFNAVKEGKMERVEKLIAKKNVDVNIRDDKDRTPLMHAVMLDNIEIARLLVKYGADVNARDIYGRSVLQLAEEGNGSLVNFLKDHGAEY
ncbi:MAG: ankyrin repeat domain-containing protein [Candidatus Micrarchaeota archaeon]|nr:ankyrin repeat domain-containing protein [Candidatus Micrarchaeota archaeon]